MGYLLGITLGPVQAYIEESRKLSDLYISSKIISRVMGNIYKYLIEKSKNFKIIYPNHEDLEDKVEYSNYMVAEVKEIIDMKDIEEEIYEIYGEEFKESFHLFWAFQEINEKGYIEAYEKLINLMDSIKNTYEFDQLTDTLSKKGNKKCSICGKRNISILSDGARKKAKLIEGEELCKICIIKRKYDTNNYPSVYEIAIKGWRKLYKDKDDFKNIERNLSNIFENEFKYYDKNEIEKLIKELKNIDLFMNRKFREKMAIYSRFSINNVKNLLKGNRNNNELSNLKDITADIRDMEQDKMLHDRIYLSEISLTELIDKLNKLKKDMDIVYNNEKISMPDYEYTFIQIDIDNLGCHMSGKYLEDKENLNDYQRELSNTLVKFGEKLKKELKDDCNIIYSGGDDFLGVLPNEQIINVISKIDEIFEKEVKSKLTKDKNNVTYSTSITIAQCKDPMDYAVRKCRLELENVKNRFEEDRIPKNGIAFTYIINNGKEITCYLKKEQLIKMIDLVNTLKTIKDQFSFAYINNFEEEFSKFNYKDIKLEDLQKITTIYKCELGRLMDRSRECKDKNEKVICYINKFLEFTVENIDRNYKKLKPNRYNLDFKNIVNCMKIYEKLAEINIDKREGINSNGIN